MDHDFILRIRAADVEGDIIRLLSREDMVVCLVGMYMDLGSTEAVFYIRISRYMLLKLKARIDQSIRYEEFSLFERVYW